MRSLNNIPETTILPRITMQSKLIGKRFLQLFYTSWGTAQEL